MLAAQYGCETLGEYRLNNLFRFVDFPKREPKDWYYGRIPDVEWKAVNCSY
jgi:hypothetical protein